MNAAVTTPLWVWIVFNLFVVAMLTLDLGLAHRRGAHAIKVKEALWMSLFWVSLAIAFNVLVFFWRGPTQAMEFLTGYLVEESLSVDNLFVFLMLFSYFKVPSEYQHKVLFWGILGAIVMRLSFILIGIALLERFHFLLYALGALLVVSGIKMAFKGEEEIHPEKNLVLRFARKVFPLTPNYEGDRFSVVKQGRRLFTPLLVVLLVVETTDIVFAMDSIPAILGITHNSFIVYSSNIFAILGLRSIFFALAGIMNLFRFLQHGLSLVLVFIGIKMLISSFYKMPVALALGTVATILVLSVVLSLLFPEKTERRDPTEE